MVARGRWLNSGTYTIVVVDVRRPNIFGAKR